MSKHPVAATGGTTSVEGHKSAAPPSPIASASAVMPAVAKRARQALEIDPIFAAIRRHTEA